MIALANAEHEAIALVASRSRKLRRCMARVQASALRRARAGQHRLASQRWGLLVELHVHRNGLLRAWGLL